LFLIKTRAHHAVLQDYFFPKKMKDGLLLLLLSLPDEVVVLISYFLPIGDVCSLRITCRAMHKVLTERAFENDMTPDPRRLVLYGIFGIRIMTQEAIAFIQAQNSIITGIEKFIQNQHFESKSRNIEKKKQLSLCFNDRRIVVPRSFWQACCSSSSDDEHPEHSPFSSSSSLTLAADGQAKKQLYQTWQRARQYILAFRNRIGASRSRDAEKGYENDIAFPILPFCERIRHLSLYWKQWHDVAPFFEHFHNLTELLCLDFVPQHPDAIRQINAKHLRFLKIHLRKTGLRITPRKPNTWKRKSKQHTSLSHSSSSSSPYPPYELLQCKCCYLVNCPVHYIDQNILVELTMEFSTGRYFGGKCYHMSVNPYPIHNLPNLEILTLLQKEEYIAPYSHIQVSILDCPKLQWLGCVDVDVVFSVPGNSTQRISNMSIHGHYVSNRTIKNIFGNDLKKRQRHVLQKQPGMLSMFPQLTTLSLDLHCKCHCLVAAKVSKLQCLKIKQYKTLYYLDKSILDSVTCLETHENFENSLEQIKQEEHQSEKSPRPVRMPRLAAMYISKRSSTSSQHHHNHVDKEFGEITILLFLVFSFSFAVALFSCLEMSNVPFVPTFHLHHTFLSSFTSSSSSQQQNAQDLSTSLSSIFLDSISTPLLFPPTPPPTPLPPPLISTLQRQQQQIINVSLMNFLNTQPYIRLVSIWMMILYVYFAVQWFLGCLDITLPYRNGKPRHCWNIRNVTIVHACMSIVSTILFIWLNIQLDGLVLDIVRSSSHAKQNSYRNRKAILGFFLVFIPFLYTILFFLLNTLRRIPNIYSMHQWRLYAPRLRYLDEQGRIRISE